MILVTGASGFLGGAVIRRLLGEPGGGEGIRALLRESSDPRSLGGLPVARVTGDLTVPGSLPAALAGVRLIYHCAGMLGQAGAPDSAYERVHVDGTGNLLRAARNAGVERVVHVSSPGVLGPIRDRPAGEGAPYNPTNAYERSKAVSERLALALAAELRVSLSVARPEFVYGPRDHHVLRLFQTIARGRFFYIGTGEALCHPTFIDDAARGIVEVGERGADGRAYHLAGPRPVKIRELVETIAQSVGVRAPKVRLPEGVVRLGVDIVERLATRLSWRPPLTRSAVDFFTFDRQFSWDRARDELGWSPQVGLRDGVGQTVAWYREQGLFP